MLKPLLLALALVGSPVLADGMPDGSIPDLGRLRAPAAAAAIAARAKPRFTPVGPYYRDAEGTRYTAADVKLGFLPVPPGYRRSDGGLVRVWNGAPAGFVVAGLDTPATITTLMARQQAQPPAPEPPAPEPPTPEPPAPPTPPDPEPPSPPDPQNPPLQDVPGPLGLGALAAAFALSRRLRRARS